MLSDEEIKKMEEISDEDKQESVLEKETFLTKGLEALKGLAKEIDPMMMLIGMPILKDIKKAIFPEESEQVSITKARFKATGIDVLTEIAKQSDPMFMLMGVPVIDCLITAFFKDVPASPGGCN